MIATAWTDGDGSGGGSNHGSLALWVSTPRLRVIVGDGDGAWAFLLVTLLAVAVGKQWYLGAIMGPHSHGEESSGNGPWTSAWLDSSTWLGGPDKGDRCR